MNAVELFAASREPRDPRPRAAIERLAADRTASKELRFSAFYLLEVLDHPRFPVEPDDFAHAERVKLALEDPAAALGPLVPYELRVKADPLGLTFGGEVTDRPWRALLRVALELRKDVTLDGRRVTLAPAKSRYEPSTLSHFMPSFVLAEFSRVLERSIVPVAPATLEKGPDGSGSWRFDDVRTLAALARLNGCRLRERDKETLEIVKGGE